MNFLCFDSETTGLNPDIHAMVEIAMIPIVNGVKGDPFVSKIRPHLGAIVDTRALEVNGLSFSQIQNY